MLADFAVGLAVFLKQLIYHNRDLSLLCCWPSGCIYTRSHDTKGEKPRNAGVTGHGFLTGSTRDALFPITGYISFFFFENITGYISKKKITAFSMPLISIDN